MAMRSTLLPLLLGALALAALAGCADPSGNGLISEHMPSPLPPDAAIPVEYPAPAAGFGITAGAIIQNFSFQGFQDPELSTDLSTVQLADFYNPHLDDPSYMPLPGADDDRFYPPGSLYNAGAKTLQPKPRALLIDISSVWCGPCNQEAKDVLPGRYAMYKPCGGQFLFQLAQGPNSGTPATEQNLLAWTSAYKVNYPSSIDMLNQLSTLYGGQTFPDEVIIDTRTMAIVSVVTAVPDDEFWSTYEGQLTPGCLAH
jgi:hypothetical protein